MGESWFELGGGDRAEALEVAAARSGRPAHLLEKDVWVVWVLSVLYGSPFSDKLTFKGGTSLSKVYRVIDRFSEDVDLTYDVRDLAGDLLRDGNPIPSSGSQARKITRAVRDRLQGWITRDVLPAIERGLAATGSGASPAIEGGDKLRIRYPAVKTGTGYSDASVLLEFGARATGEPHHRHSVACDMALHIVGVDFPTAAPLVMAIERTFWEKATAAHVYCRQGESIGHRFSRHWYDLAAIARSTHFDSAAKDLELARAVATHKSAFFSEQDPRGGKVDYLRAVTGSLQLVPTGPSLSALERDYSAMLDDGLLPLGSPDFDQVMAECAAVERRVNEGAAPTRM